MPTADELRASAATLPPVDPAVMIPEAVRRMAAKAESYYQTPASGEAAPVAVAPAAPIAPTPPPPPAAPEPPAPALPVSKQSPAAEELTQQEWKTRFDSVNGRYAADHRRITELEGQLGMMADECQRLTAVVNQRPAQQVAPLSTAKRLTDKDLETYGEDLIDVVTRAAQDAVAPQIAAVAQETDAIKTQSAKTRRQGVYVTLDQDVPEWRKINASPEWKSWLRLPDLYSGQVRQGLLDEAMRTADAVRVVAFFNGYLRENGGTAQPEPEPQPALLPAERAPAVSLEVLAAPGRPRPASGSDNPNSPAIPKPIITRKNISDFYAAVRRGAYEGQEARKIADEAVLHAATREGRVRG